MYTEGWHWICSGLLSIRRTGSESVCRVYGGLDGVSVMDCRVYGGLVLGL